MHAPAGPGRSWYLAVAVVLASCTAAPPISAPPSAGATSTTSPLISTPLTSRQQETPPTGSTHSITTGPDSALAALHSLPVRGRAPRTGYSRGRFGNAWTDDVTVNGGHNGCDTRNDVLRRDLAALVTKAGTQGCVAASGTLRDPYTGHEVKFLRGEKTSLLVQIDHVVSLSDAWQTGARALGATQRQELANDPLELLAVDGPTNQAKGDGDAATWLPPHRAYRCEYVARQIAVKALYRLWVTAAERAAMESVLDSCPGQALPTSAGVEVPAVG